MDSDLPSVDDTLNELQGTVRARYRRLVASIFLLGVVTGVSACAVVWALLQVL